MNTEMKKESSNEDILLELRNKYKIAKLLKSEDRQIEMRKNNQSSESKVN